MTICWLYSNVFDDHGRNFAYWQMYIDPSTGVGQMRYWDRSEFYIYHGIMNFIAWSVLGFLLVISGKYMHVEYKLGMILHIVSGTLTLGLTAVLDIWAWALYQGEGEGLHYALGIIVLIAVFVEVIFGYVLWMGLVFCPQNKTRIWVKLLLGHKWFGWLLVVFSQFVCWTGLWEFDTVLQYPFIGYALIGFLVLGVFQIRKRKWQKRPELPEHMKKAEDMSPEQYDELLQQGKKLCIFNKQVVDVGPYEAYHPGGANLIAKSVGQEIGKYIDGGYIWENKTGLAPHDHMEQVPYLLNKMCMAYIVHKSAPLDTEVHEPCTIKTVNDINSTTATYEFKSKAGNKKFYEVFDDFGGCGMHYVISTKLAHKQKKNKRRYYTISNVMRPNVYKGYVDELKKALAGETATSNPDFISATLTDNLVLTLKKYDVPDALSKHMCEVQGEQEYIVHGPYGKGLNIDPTKPGTYIAFTAGTGNLVFVDTVATIARAMLGWPNAQQLHADLKFIFYVSFPTREDVIALELCDTLHKLC